MTKDAKKVKDAVENIRKAFWSLNPEEKGSVLIQCVDDSWHIPELAALSFHVNKKLSEKQDDR